MTRSLFIRLLMPLIPVALLIPACGDSGERITDTTLAPTTTEAVTTTTAPTTTAAPSTITTAARASLVYVPMGNSLTFTPSGAGESLFVRYRSMLAEDFAADVEVRSHQVSGETSAEFLDRLRTDEDLRADLAEADVITLLIPNDEWAEPTRTATGAEGRDPAACGGDDNQQCLRDMIDDYRDHVDQIFRELTALVDPSETVIRAQDVYLVMTNVLTDERFAVLYPYWREGQEYVEEVAGEYGIPVAQVWDDFMGSDGAVVDLVEMGLVVPDGIHPTAEGAERMADLMHDLGYDLAP
jgi:lysophospholipase L1-like esterase